MRQEISAEESFFADVKCAVDAADILKALAHPTRLRILAVLVRGDAHVGSLAERLGVQQPVVSQQLRILRMRNLVDCSRVNGLAVYRLAEPHVREIIDCLRNCLCARGESRA